MSSARDTRAVSDQDGAFLDASLGIAFCLPEDRYTVHTREGAPDLFRRSPASAVLFAEDRFRRASVSFRCWADTRDVAKEIEHFLGWPPYNPRHTPYRLTMRAEESAVAADGSRGRMISSVVAFFTGNRVVSPHVQFLFFALPGRTWLITVYNHAPLSVPNEEEARHLLEGLRFTGRS